MGCQVPRGESELGARKGHETYKYMEDTHRTPRHSFLPGTHGSSSTIVQKKRTPLATSCDETIPPTIQVSSLSATTNCSTDRRWRPSARTGGGNSRPGIRGWRISGSLHELAACSGTKLVQGSF